MALDLSALDVGAAPPSPALSSATGEPLRAPLSKFYEDPNQPRTEFEPESLAELAEDIKLRGVMSAILVRPPGPDGRMMIIQGARRFRGSTVAGVADIPYVVKADEKVFDDYSQVAENLKRQALTPMELAMFVNKRVTAGDKAAFIAKQLGMHRADLVPLLTLTRAPSYVIALYESGKCRTPKYLYELENLAKTHPAEVEHFCSTSEDFRGVTISAFADQFVGNSNKSPASSSLSKSEPKADGGGRDADRGGSTGDAGSVGGSKDGESHDQVGRQQLPFHDPRTEQNTGKTTLPDPTKIRRPLLLGVIEKRSVMVLLHKRPSNPKMVHVKFEDGSGEDEVQFSSVKDLMLTEASA